MPGGFTGNRSVDWFVTAENARPGKTKVRTVGRQSVEHQGIEETPAGGGYRFVITINHPQNDTERQAFLAQLVKAAADKRSRRTILTIPVEDVASGYQPPIENQITIDWKGPSTMNAAASPARKRKGSRSKPEPQRSAVDIRF